MLGFLFRGLTSAEVSGEKLFGQLTVEARKLSWFVEGQVPDTIDGRFAVLASIVALTLVRLEREGDAGNRLSVALTEQFIAVMDSEHREMGISDPTLGKTVRKLVAMLARRTDAWRLACGNEADWTETTRRSLYGGPAAPEALKHSAEALRLVSDRLAATSIASLERGELE